MLAVPTGVLVQVCNLLDANQRMQEELMEKDQAIKVLQQKMADLKKTLQKELVCSQLLAFLECGFCSLTADSLCVSDAEIPFHCSCPLGKSP